MGISIFVSAVLLLAAAEASIEDAASRTQVDEECLLQVERHVTSSHAQKEDVADKVEPVFADLSVAGSQGHTSNESYCIEGKLAPLLYVPGVAKAGTSSTFYLFNQSGISVSCPSLAHKECQIFTASPKSVEYHAQTSFENKKKVWLGVLEDCPAAGVKKVVGDYTAVYLNAVPPPAGLTLKGIVWGPLSEEAVQLGQEINVPRDMSIMHGDRAKDLTLVVTLREPLARMQSAWYMAQKMLFTGMSALAAPTFSKALDITAKQYFEQSIAQDILWMSMYALHFKVWLQYFEAKQFIIYPQDYLNEPSKMTEMCTAAMGRLGLPVGDCGSFGIAQEQEQEEASARRNVGSHPPLSEEPAAALAPFNDTIFPPLNAQFFEILGSMHASGATLVGYTGPGDAASLEAWLTADW